MALLKVGHRTARRGKQWKGSPLMLTGLLQTMALSTAALISHGRETSFLSSTHFTVTTFTVATTHDILAGSCFTCFNLQVSLFGTKSTRWNFSYICWYMEQSLEEKPVPLVSRACFFTEIPQGSLSRLKSFERRLKTMLII